MSIKRLSKPGITCLCTCESQVCQKLSSMFVEGWTHASLLSQRQPDLGALTNSEPGEPELLWTNGIVFQSLFSNCISEIEINLYLQFFHSLYYSPQKPLFVSSLSFSYSSSSHSFEALFSYILSSVHFSSFSGFRNYHYSTRRTIMK